MKLDFKKLVSKIVPSLGLALMFLLTGTGIMGCGSAPVEQNEGIQQTEEAPQTKPTDDFEILDEDFNEVEDENTQMFEEVLEAIRLHKDGTITIYDHEVDAGHYHLVQDNALWQVNYEEDDIKFEKLMDLGPHEVAELEVASIGFYIDHDKVDESIVPENEFWIMKDDQITVTNLNGDKIQKEVPEQYIEEIYNAINGYVIDVDQLVFEEPQ